MPMRVEASVLSVSWIPSEAVTGMTKLPFEVGMTHYDDPPPERISGPEELEALRAAGRFRFATLRAVTPCRVAVAPDDAIDMAALAELSEGHRREGMPPA